MKNFFKLAISAALILSLLAGMALAEAYDTSVYIITDCNVYAEASQSSTVVDTMQAGSLISYVGEETDADGLVWYNISFGDESGYVSSESAALMPMYDYIPEDESGYIYINCFSGIVASGGDSNIRTEPDREAEIIGLLKQDSTAIYTNISFVDYRGVRWDFVEFEGSDGIGHDGWVSSMYTSPVEAE